MNFDEMSQAVDHAKSTLRNADCFVGSMARMVAGRLRKSGVSYSTLTRLKKELKDFNMHTGRWKDE